VMVVLLGALQIDRLAVLARQDVHVAGVNHESQSPVDRTESDVVSAPSQHGMDLLGAAEVVELREQVSDSLAASSFAARGDPLRWALVHGSEEPGRAASDPRRLLRYQRFPSPADANTGRTRRTATRPSAACDGGPVHWQQIRRPHLGPSTRPARSAGLRAGSVSRVQTEAEPV
jgi:hypothetical protein